MATAVTPPVQQMRVPVVVAVGVAANAATAIWVGVAVYVSGRGLGLGNEGFYLLAYRNWSTKPRTFTGAQYLYGPLLEVLGDDIGLLRLCRLALVLAAHAVFAVAFVRWLREERPQAVPDRATAYCAASLVVATGAILYGWLPATPGYNDVTTLGSLVLLSVILSSLRAAATGRPLAWQSGAAYGATVAAMVLAKPPVALALIVIAAGTVYAFRLADAPGVARFLVGAVGGVAAFAMVVQLFVAPWIAIVPPIREQLSVVADNSHPPLEVVRWYLSSSATVVADALIICAPLALILLAVLGLRWTGWRRLAGGLVGLLASVTLAIAIGGLDAGGGNVLAFSSAVLAMLLIALIAGFRSLGSLRASGRLVAIALLVVPALQGFGTNNALYAVAINGAAAWVALMLLALAGISPRPVLSHVVPRVATLVAVALAVTVGVDGVSHDGTGQPLLAGSMRHVSGVPELSSLVLPRVQADGLSAFRRELGDLAAPNRPMLALGDIAQYVLVLGGQPIGESWFSSTDDGLNRADLMAACSRGNPWGALQPLVVATRSPSAGELEGWRSCGIDFQSDYRDVTPSSAPHGVRVFAPRSGFLPGLARSAGS